MEVETIALSVLEDRCEVLGKFPDVDVAMVSVNREDVGRDIKRLDPSVDLPFSGIIHQIAGVPAEISDELWPGEIQIVYTKKAPTKGV